MDYPNTTITFLIEYDGKFLLISRSSKEVNFPNLWAFPGGKVELGETAVDTIKREVNEETGLEIMDEAIFLNSYVFKKTVGLSFLVRAKHDSVKISKEFDDYRWVATLEELKNYNCIPGIHNHLERAKILLEKGHFDSLEDMNLIETKYINKD